MYRMNVKFYVTNKPRRFVIDKIEYYAFETSESPVETRSMQAVYTTPEHMLRNVDKFALEPEVDHVTFSNADENSADAMKFLFDGFYIGGGSDPFFFLESGIPDYYADEHSTFFSQKIAGYFMCKTQGLLDANIPIEEWDTVMELILDWYDLDGEYFHWIEDDGYPKHQGDIDIDICRYVED